MVWIERLRVVDLRNHASTVVSLPRGLVLLIGPNGAGKTSLLEAVHLLARGGSFRPTRDAALLREDESGAASRAFVECDAERSGRRVRVGVGVGDVSPRYHLNGSPRQRARDVLGVLRCVVFSPDDLDLVKGGPAGRRGWLDGTMAGVAPRTLAVVQEWERVLRQRNALLKTLPRGARDAPPAALETWTGLLVEKGAALAAERMRIAQRLSGVFATSVAELGGGEASMHYAASWRPAETGFEDDVDEAVLAAQLADDVRAHQAAEMERRVTLVGPHRDDLVLRLGGRDARTRASQGEQRVMALALRLSELRLIEDALGEEPVLLLDDVFSELDGTRRSALLDVLPQAQTFITATSERGSEDPAPEILETLRRAGLLAEDDGNWGIVRLEDGAIVDPAATEAATSPDTGRPEGHQMQGQHVQGAPS